MSLLNLLQSDDPAIQNGLLNFGLALMRSKGNFGNAVGQAGVAGQLGARDFRQQQALMSRTSLNDQLLKNNLEQQQRQLALQDLPTQFTRTPQQVAMAANGGPTNAAAEAVPTTQPGFDMQGYLQALPGLPGGLQESMRLQEALQKKAPNVKERDPSKEMGYVDPTTLQWKTVSPGVEKPKDINPNQPFMVIDGKIVPNKAYQDYELSKADRIGTKITNSVNTGQKGFDNTLKLRGDFRSEPIYKAHQEMQSAYSQIQQSLKQESPAGDLAGATKIMKLLDPGSVVRESELGMAMAASGLLDRMQNYASMVISGTKLTPNQRKDFQTLADALYGESVKQYNTKRMEYKSIAERNGLTVPDVVGSESKAPETNGGWSITRVP